MTSTPNTPIEELALIFKTHTFERSGLIDVPSVKIALLAWRDRAVAEADRLKKDLTPDKLLLAENKRLREAGDALYERASYTGRSFDGTHRLLSAAAHWLDVRGKSSGEYQASRLTTPTKEREETDE